MPDKRPNKYASVQLTDNEKKLLRAYNKGATNRAQVCKATGLSIETARRLEQDIPSKLDTYDMSEAADRARGAGLL